MFVCYQPPKSKPRKLQQNLRFVGTKYESLQILILTHNLRDQRWLKYIDISTYINHIGRIKGYI